MAIATDGPAVSTERWLQRLERRYGRIESRLGEDIQRLIECVRSHNSLDIFTCSMCGSLYQFEESEGRRRPRMHARRFCSPTCRAGAKRADNLASWHRNKKRRVYDYL